MDVLTSGRRKINQFSQNRTPYKALKNDYGVIGGKGKEKPLNLKLDI